MKTKNVLEGEQPEVSDDHAQPISRRGFLRKASAAAALGAVAPVALAGAKAPTKKNSGEIDAVVIGAGFAGLVAARELSHAGKRVILLEARNRIGGRTFYTKWGDKEHEMGGTFVHWIQPHTWSEITRYGLEIIPTPGVANPERVMWLSEGKVHEPSPADSYKLLQDITAKFHEDADKVFPRPYVPTIPKEYAELDQMSIADRIKQLNLPADQRDFLQSVMNANVSGFAADGAYVEMLRWWKLANKDMALLYDACINYRIKTGTRSLAEAIMKDGGYEVRLSSPVSTVEQRARDAVVTLESGEKIRSKAVVVAVPMNTLNQIDFRPGLLPGKVAAAKEKHCGAGTKVYMKVKGSLKDFQAYATEPEPFSVILSYHLDKDGGEILAFGPSSKLVDVHSAKEVEKALRKFFPDVKVEEVYSYDWALDPYSQGTWPTLRPMQITRYLKDLQSPEGRLFFATSDIASGWRGFIDGAIESGLTAGRGAIKLLSGQG